MRRQWGRKLPEHERERRCNGFASCAGLHALQGELQPAGCRIHNILQLLHIMVDILVINICKLDGDFQFLSKVKKAVLRLSLSEAMTTAARQAFRWVVREVARLA